MPDESQARVLLVDDEPALARVYARALVAAGFEVDLASDGIEGLNRLLAGSYDVLVSDICMPRMSGLRLLDAIRKMRPDIPVVLMTAQLDPATYERARELGTVRYLLKPFALDQLARAVRSAAMLRAAWQRSSARRQSPPPR
jgi:two-component system chemotaxis response regulator CheY